MIGEWCTIESDPWTFTELAKRLGIQGVQFEEVLDLDAGKELVERFETVYGFIFLFKWDEKDQAKRQTVEHEDNLFFIKQIVTNACATIAILNIAFNLGHSNYSSIKFSKPLMAFKEFTTELPAEMRGMSLTNSEEIRSAHNSFIAHGSLNADANEPSSKGEAFHFVALLPKDGKLIELDGMRDEPVAHGSISTEDPITDTLQWLKERINSVEGGELRFSLLAMVPDQIQRFEKELEKCDDPAIMQIIQERLEIEQEKRKPPPPPPQPKEEIANNSLSESDQQQLKLALDLIESMKRRGVFG